MVLDEHILQSFEEEEEDRKDIQFLPNSGFRSTVLRVRNQAEERTRLQEPICSDVEISSYTDVPSDAISFFTIC